jgi:hypothetical protein
MNYKLNMTTKYEKITTINYNFNIITDDNKMQ